MNILLVSFLLSVNVFQFLHLQTSAVCIRVGIASFAVGLKICTITAAIKKYKSIIKKIEKKHDHIVLLAKTKSNTIEVLISKALSDAYSNHDEFVLVDNVLREYNKMKEKIKNPGNAVE